MGVISFIFDLLEFEAKKIMGVLIGYNNYVAMVTCYTCIKEMIIAYSPMSTGICLIPYHQLIYMYL